MRAYGWVSPGTKVFLYCKLQSRGIGHVNSHEKLGNHLPLLFSIVLGNFVFRWPSCEREWAKGFSASFCFREFTGLKAELLGCCNSWKVCTDVVLLRDGLQTCLLTGHSAIRHECLCAYFPWGSSRWWCRVCLSVQMFFQYYQPIWNRRAAVQMAIPQNFAFRISWCFRCQLFPLFCCSHYDTKGKH